MRFYGIGNMYLSSIQQGIQAAHVIANISANILHSDANKNTLIFKEWAANFKTIVLLNGGGCRDIETVYSQIFARTGLPSAAFFEDETLNYSCTAAGIIVPTAIVRMIELIRTGEAYENMNFLYGNDPVVPYGRELAEFIAKCSLAR